MRTSRRIVLFLSAILLALGLITITQQVGLLASPASSLQFVELVNLGVPAGNITTPRRLALNSQAAHLYLLGEGVPILREGNHLGLYNLETGEIEKSTPLNEGDNEALDLQIDPEAGLLYALWRNRNAEDLPVLTVVNEETLQPVQEIPGVEAIAAGEGHLYTSNTNQLTDFEVTGTGLTETQRLDLPPATPGPMAVQPGANRLYLARNTGESWTLQIFEADTLTSLSEFQADGPILDVLPLPQRDEVFLVVAQNDFRLLYRLNSMGELVDLPYELGPRFGAEGIALSEDGQHLYYSNGELRPLEPVPGDQPEPALIGLAVDDLSPVTRVPLLTNFDDLAVDERTGQAFALYPYNHFLYQVDLTEETVQIVTTAIELRDVLVDEASGVLFVSDNSNRIRRLDAETFELLAENRLASNLTDYGFQVAPWSGELALDQTQERLYVSGLPALVLDAETLAEVVVLEPGGQLAPDSLNDKIYVSNCGVKVLETGSFTEIGTLPESGRREDGLAPNPCVDYSQLDAQNQLLYSLVPNGVPGSNSGTYLYVYDVSLEPSLVFTDTNISIIRVEPDPAEQRAFVNYVRHSNRRVLTLDAAAPEAMGYTHQLLGVWGDTLYSPDTGQLYLSDSDHNRLLALEADTLSVTDELGLPLNYGFRLSGLDPEAENLYLIGLKGQLLVVSAAGPAPDTSAALAELISPLPARVPDGSVLALAQAEETIFARIEASYSEYSSEIRLYTSSDEGQSWQDLSQNLSPLPVQALAVSSDSASGPVLFAGLSIPGQAGGLYKSTDGGQSWQSAMKGLNDLWADRLFISPDFDQNGLIFADTTYAGLHQSGDGGESWQPLVELDPNALFPVSSNDNAVAFGGEGVVLVSQDLDEMRGIFRAEVGADGSLSPWQQVLDIPVSHLALSPDGTTALAFGTGLWYSQDGGQSWQAGGAGLTGVENLQADRILFSPTFADDQTVYFFFKDFSGTTSGRLFRSTDGGESWSLWLAPSGEEIFTAVTLTPEGDLLFGTDQAQVIRVDPAVLSWSAEASITAASTFDDLAVSPSFEQDQTIFAISKQEGLFQSNDGGQSWELIPFPARSFGFTGERYRLAISPNFAQDQTLYVATGRSLHRSTDGGQSWSQLSKSEASDPSSSFQAQQVALLPNFANERSLLAGTASAIYRSTNGGETWQEVLTSTAESGVADVLSVAPEEARVYAHFGYSADLFVSLDGGQSWQRESGDPNDLFSVVSSDTGPDGTLSVALEYDNRLFQAGPQTPPWRQVDQPPETALTSLSAVTYGDSGAIFIGGHGGVFRSLDNGQSWQSMPAEGLPLDATVKALRLSETQLFALISDGRIFALPLDGTSWTNISVVK